MSEVTRELPPHEAGDIPIYHTVVRILGIVTVLSIGGAIILSVIGRPIPESVVALGSVAIGALAGLLAPSPGTK